jgi:hypothetical protein
MLNRYISHAERRKLLLNEGKFITRKRDCSHSYCGLALEEKSDPSRVVLTDRDLGDQERPQVQNRSHTNDTYRQFSKMSLSTLIVKPIHRSNKT